MDEERYPLADFYGAYLEELFGEKQYEELQACLIPDELHMRAWDYLILAIAVNNEFDFDKYLAITRQLDQFNWVHCD